MSRLKKIAIIIFLALIALYYVPLAPIVGQPLVVREKLAKADAIVILSGGLKPDGSLGISTRERLNYGLKLFQKGYASRVVFSGGNLLGGRTDADAMLEEALDQGFSEESIVLENRSSSTYENILFTTALLKEKGYKRIILVTSPYHTRRAKVMFSDKGVKTISAPVPDSEFYSARGLGQLRTLKLVFMEYVKLGAYKALGQGNVFYGFPTALPTHLSLSSCENGVLSRFAIHGSASDSDIRVLAPRFHKS